MKIFMISFLLLGILGVSSSFASEGQKLERKTVIKKPPHGDDGTGGNGGNGGKPLFPQK